MATEKQVSYALSLMDKAGYPTKWMSAAHKALGASMRERSGRVEDWLRGMNTIECGRVIDRLRMEHPPRQAAQAERPVGANRESEA